jgi:hypothetical protein
MSANKKLWGVQEALSIDACVNRSSDPPPATSNTEESTSGKANYPSPHTDRDASTISSTERSSVHYGHMEQHLFIKVS